MLVLPPNACVGEPSTGKRRSRARSHLFPVASARAHGVSWGRRPRLRPIIWGKMWTHSTFCPVGPGGPPAKCSARATTERTTRLSEAPEHALLLTSTLAGPVTLVFGRTIVTGPAGSVYRCGTGRGNCAARTRHTPPQGEKDTTGPRVPAFSPAVAVLCDRRGVARSKAHYKPPMSRERAIKWI